MKAADVKAWTPIAGVALLVAAVWYFWGRIKSAAAPVADAVGDVVDTVVGAVETTTEAVADAAAGSPLGGQGFVYQFADDYVSYATPRGGTIHIPLNLDPAMASQRVRYVAADIGQSVNSVWAPYLAARTGLPTVAVEALLASGVNPERMLQRAETYMK